MLSQTPYIEKEIVVGPFQCNCKILVCGKTGHALIVDPGDDALKIHSAIKTLEKDHSLKVQVKMFFHTHGHLDHIAGTRQLKEILQKNGDGAPLQIALHQKDLELYQNLPMQGQFFGISYDAPLPVDRFLEEGEVLEMGQIRFQVIHTPGHSPGSICLKMNEDSSLGNSETVFCGDTLFQGSIGCTDLWGGDADLLLKSIRTRLFTLDDATRVCPGHGPQSTIGIEKRENPFF